MIVIVCGSRFWPPARRGPIHAWLAGLWADHPQLTVLEGGARGADRIAGQWAAKRRMQGVAWIRFTAHWDAYPKWERWKAGHDRNQEMLDWMLLCPPEEPRLVLAFKDGFDWELKSGGTEDMVRRARLAGVSTYVTSRATRKGEA